MITLIAKLEVYDVNPKRVKLTIQRPPDSGTAPYTEGHIVLTADDTAAHFPDAVTGQQVGIDIDPSTIE